MPSLLPLVFVGLLGALFILNLTRRVKISTYPLFVLSLAFPVGLSICSLLLFTTYLLNARQAPFLSIFMSLGLTALFLVKLIFSASNISEPDSTLKPLKNWSTSLSSPWNSWSIVKRIGLLTSLAVWSFTFIKFCHLFQSVSLNNIFGGWDARFFWNVKASFFFRSPEE